MKINYSKKCNVYSKFDRDILKKIMETKQFLKNNKQIFVTHTDKSSATVVVKKENYINKVYPLTNDINSNKNLDLNPETQFENLGNPIS